MQNRELVQNRESPLNVAEKSSAYVEAGTYGADGGNTEGGKHKLQTGSGLRCGELRGADNNTLPLGFKDILLNKQFSFQAKIDEFQYTTYKQTCVSYQNCKKSPSMREGYLGSHTASSLVSNTLHNNIPPLYCNVIPSSFGVQYIT